MMTNTMTGLEMPRSENVAQLRQLAKNLGLGYLSIVAGKGCARGLINVRVRHGATRDERLTAVAFLVSVKAACPVVDITRMPEHFDGCYVSSFELTVAACESLNGSRAA
jgi:hypothetical protein